MKKVNDMDFEELYRLVSNEKKLKDYVKRESRETGMHPFEVLYRVVMVFRERAREMAERN